MSKIEWPSDIVKEWLENNLGNPKESSGGSGTQWTYNEFLIDDGKKKLYVNVDDGEKCGKWIGFKSGYSGDFVELVAKYKDISRKAAYKEIVSEYKHHLTPSIIYGNSNKKESNKTLSVTPKDANILLPDKLYEVKFSDEFSKPYIQYLRNRGMTDEFITSCYYSFARKYQKRPFAFMHYVIIPYRDKFGKIIYWMARSIFPDYEPKYFNCPMADASNYVWNIDTSAEKVVLCEGVIDAESFDGCGIAAGGKNLSETQLRKILSADFKEIIIGGNNEEYEKGPMKMIDSFKKFKQQGVKVYIFDWIEYCKKELKTPVNDFNELSLRKKRKLTYEEIREYCLESYEVAEVKYRLNEAY